ncbi:MAG: sensor histidine kinase [Gemmatimonadaceae bacterium]
MSIQSVSSRQASRRQPRRDPPPMDRDAAIRETTELMSTVLDSFPGYVALLDAEGVVFGSNCGWTDLNKDAGRDSIACAPVGENYLIALREAVALGHEHAECLLDALSELREEPSRARVERRCGSSDGKLLAFVAARLRRPTGGVVLTAVDVTMWATSASALQHAQRDLMKAAQLAVAGELVGGITHDLRQPLTSLQMNLETAEYLLRQTPANVGAVATIMTEAVSDSRRLRDSVQVLQDLVSRREPSRANVVLRAAVADVVRLVQSEAMARHVVLEHSLFGEQLEISADPNMLREAVLSLLLDAIENCDTSPGAGRVSVATRVADDHHVALTVTYQRAQRVAGDEGWAVSVVRSVVDAHDAYISIEEKDDSVVTVTTTWPTGPERLALTM